MGSLKDSIAATRHAVLDMFVFQTFALGRDWIFRVLELAMIDSSDRRNRVFRDAGLRGSFLPEILN